MRDTCCAAGLGIQLARVWPIRGGLYQLCQSGRSCSSTLHHRSQQQRRHGICHLARSCCDRQAPQRQRVCPLHAVRRWMRIEDLFSAVRAHTRPGHEGDEIGGPRRHGQHRHAGRDSNVEHSARVSISLCCL